jgi:hypothetical protein
MPQRHKRWCNVLMLLLLALVSTISITPVFAQEEEPAASSEYEQVFLPNVLQQQSTAAPSAGTFFVDSKNGSDNNPGNSEQKPLKTLDALNQRDLKPGNIVRFKRGSTWTGKLDIYESGTQDRPILFTTYGSGPDPVLRAADERVISIKANWVIVEGLRLQDAREEGIKIYEGANHNILRKLEITNVGIGIWSWGQNNLITRNQIHDLHMVVNTPGGNDDYGAVAVVLSNSNNEVSYNRMINCIATSQDYGFDGGAVEWWSNADNNFVHHNFSYGNDGFLEVGGGSARNTLVAYNVSVNSRRFAVFHLSGVFGSAVENFRIENNTIVEAGKDYWGWDVLYFDDEPNGNTINFQNNLLYIDGFSKVANRNGFSHHHNLYNLTNGTQLGFSLGQGEKSGDPQFANLVGGDFHLKSSSPSIDAGMNLGYQIDFEGKPVPSGSAPDFGAYEFQR